ncbi:MAG: hypothetical protein AB8G26_12860 [Ilumatobacter sp.]
MSGTDTTRLILCRRDALLAGAGTLAVGEASQIVADANARVTLTRVKLGRVRRIDVWRSAGLAVVHEHHATDAGSGLVMPSSQVGVHVARVWSGMLGPLASGATDESIEFDLDVLDTNRMLDDATTTAVTVSLDLGGETVQRVVTVQHRGGTFSATLRGASPAGSAIGVDAIRAWAAVDSLLDEWTARAADDQSFERSST